MKQQEEITFQTLADNEDIQIGYSDNDIVVVDSIQQFAEIHAAHVSMNAIAICTSGKVQGIINGQQIELHQNQVAIIPQNIVVTDVMVSPDFNLKAMFLTNRILQSFLREKMNVWTDMLYIHKLRIIPLEADELAFLNRFYELLKMVIHSTPEAQYKTDIMHSLLRGALLALCSALKSKLPMQAAATPWPEHHSHRLFQRFIDLLSSTEVKHRPVEQYANELCVTPKYLSAISKKHSGKTANAWITEHVVEDIRYYLKSTDLSIKEVSVRLGFPNTSFFGKYVKDHFGMTPSEFRKWNVER